MIRFSKIIRSTWKKSVKELVNFYIDGKKKFKVISALKDFNDRNKIVKEGSRIPNIIKEHFTTIRNRLSNNLPIPPKNHLDYVDKCKSSISSYLFRHVLPEYYLYRMMNLMVYTPPLSNVQLPS